MLWYSFLSCVGQCSRCGALGLNSRCRTLCNRYSNSESQILSPVGHLEASTASTPKLLADKVKTCFFAPHLDFPKGRLQDCAYESRESRQSNYSQLEREYGIIPGWYTKYAARDIMQQTVADGK